MIKPQNTDCISTFFLNIFFSKIRAECGLYLVDSVQGMKVRANVAQQINNLPDGAKINIRVVN